MALPSGYNILEYIQSSGTQYIDTDFLPTQDTRLVLDFTPVSVNGSHLFGSRSASTASDYFLLLCTGGYYRDDYAAEKTTTSVAPTTTRTTIDKNKNVTSINGVITTHTYATFSGSFPIVLFASDTGGDVSYFSSFKLHRCKIYDNGTLARDYIPCETPSGEIGLWDDANGVFYANAGTGVFAAGPVANDGRLEYIESSGTQYIDTGFKPNQDTRVVCDIFISGTLPTSNFIPFGCRTSASGGYFYPITSNGAWAYCFGSKLTESGVTTSGRILMDSNKNTLFVNDEAIVVTNNQFSGAYPIFIFALNQSGSAGFNSSYKLYSFRIYDNGTLVRDYIPCRYNGEVGLWDRVSNTFYGNSGSGVFTAGPEAVYERVEYIQSSGTQYVDTGFVPDANTRVTSMFQMVSPGTANECIFGVVGQFSFRWYGSGGCFRSNGANNANFATTIPSGSRHTVTKTPTTCTIDNVYTVTNTVGTVTSSLYIFAQRGASAPTAYAKVKVFSFRVFDGDALVRDFVPVVRSDGTAGLYDQLNEIFHENAGTGTFVAGPIAKYAKVEYIESTGTQYIDTGFKPDQNTRVVCEVSGYPSTLSSQALFGCRTSGSANDQYLVTATGSSYRSDFYNGQLSFPSSVSYPDRVIVDKNKNETTIGESTVSHVNGDFSCAYDLTLFALNNGGSMVAYTSGVRMYSCQIYDNGILVRDFVPAVRADGTPGLLDQTNNAFYTNSGTGTFVAGPDLDYTKLEYIESTGTQYVDTGFIPNQDTRVVMDCQAYSTYNGGNFPFGVRAGLKNKAFAVALTGPQVFYNYASNYQFADYPTTLERMMVDANKNVATFAGSTTATISLASGTFACDSTLLLATFNNAGTPDVGDPAWVGAIWSCQIYDNGVLIRDYVPALRENGQIGLIDLVSGLFYANAGSGVFIAGPEIVDPDPPEPPGPYEPPSFTEQTLAYLAALRYPFYKLCRLRFLQPDGSTAFSLDNNPKNRRSGAFIADGSISANLQNGKRRNATVTLSNLDSSFDYNVNTVWFGTEIAIDEGLVLPDGSEYYIQQGVFAIENPTEAVEPANRTATYNLVDKWSYLDGTLFGNLESTYEVPVGTNIFQPIQAILALDRGNGQPVDGVTPIFTEYYNSKTQALPDGSTSSLIDSPYTLRIDSDNGTYADVLLGLAGMVNAWIGYDQTGALRIDPSQDDILDTNKPILWQFSMDEATFLGANYTVRNVDVYNDYIVLGELLDDNSQPSGRATNLDPRSDTNVQTIGRKTFRMSAPGFATDQQCQDLAVWKLKRSTSLQKAITISCSQLFHIEENGLVTIVRTDKPGSPVERHLVMGFTRPLTSNGEMQINAVSVQDFVTATVTSWPE